MGQAASTTGYTLTTADGQITSLRIDDRELVSAPALALLLRDLSDAGTVVTPNLVTNSGFEEGLTGWTQVDPAAVPGPGQRPLGWPALST